MSSAVPLAEIAVRPHTKRRITDMLSRILDSVNKLDETRRSFLTLLPNLDDEEVIEARMHARVAGCWAWIIECACDAEMFKRDEAKRGRGNKDEEGKGRLATARKQAYLDGKGVSTLYKNAQIFRTFENVLTNENILPLQDKGFFLAALSAPDPVEAVEAFAKEKSDNAFYEPCDAWRDVKKIKRGIIERKNELSKKADDEDAPRRKKLREHFQLTRIEMERRKAICAEIDPITASRFYNDWIQSIIEQDEEWEIQDLRTTIDKLWHSGAMRTDQLAKGLALPVAETERIMKRLKTEGVYMIVYQRGTDDARGKAQPLWHLVGEPVFD